MTTDGLPPLRTPMSAEEFEAAISGLDVRVDARGCRHAVREIGKDHFGPFPITTGIEYREEPGGVYYSAGTFW